MGGNYTLVLVGRIADVEVTSTRDGYRKAVMSVEAVLRGTADKSWSFFYPAAEDDLSPYVREGRRYLVALTLDADDRWITQPMQRHSGAGAPASRARSPDSRAGRFSRRIALQTTAVHT
jgi:hypothetical protein